MMRDSHGIAVRTLWAPSTHINLASPEIHYNKAIHTSQDCEGQIGWGNARMSK